MNNVKAIENEIQRLSRQELALLREWFIQYDNEEWDRQIDADVLSGKLDTLSAKAISSHERGESTEL